MEQIHVEKKTENPIPISSDIPEESKQIEIDEIKKDIESIQIEGSNKKENKGNFNEIINNNSFYKSSNENKDNK